MMCGHPTSQPLCLRQPKHWHPHADRLIHQVHLQQRASAFHYNVMHWPYTSNYNDITKQVMMKISGGITCYTVYDTFVLDGNVTGAFVELWMDKVANITVERTPSINHNTYMQLQSLNVKNPSAYQRNTYEQIKEIEVLFYDNYKNRSLSLRSQWTPISVRPSIRPSPTATLPLHYGL